MEKIRPELILKVSDDVTEQVVKDEALAVVKACYQCGTCTGGCPSGRRTAIRTRQIMRKALLGLDAALSDEDLWLCSTCYTCYERCPRNIPVTDVIIKLRNLASQRGYMKPAHVKVTHILSEWGHGVPLGTTEADPGNQWSKMRASYGLPPIPPTTHSHPEAVKDCRTLMHDTKFDELIGWETENENEKEEKEAKDTKKKTNQGKDKGKKN